MLGLHPLIKFLDIVSASLNRDWLFDPGNKPSNDDSLEQPFVLVDGNVTLWTYALDAAEAGSLKFDGNPPAFSASYLVYLHSLNPK